MGLREHFSCASVTKLLTGYAAYLAMIFAPGIGFGELLSLWRSDSGLAERLSIAFGLGLSVDTFFLLIRTSGINIFGHILLGITPATPYFIITVGIIALLVSVCLRRGEIQFPTKPKGFDLAIFSIVAVQGLMLLLYFQKYPIFPAFGSGDFHEHVSLARDMIFGTIVYNGFPRVGYFYPTGGILYAGVHYQLASAFVLVGGENLITAQRVMAILVALSSLLFYLVPVKVLSSRRAGLVVTAVYALSATIWSDSVLDTGLYANFFGILVTLFLIVAVVQAVAEPRAVSSWIVLILATLNLYMSHYSDLTVLPAFVVLPIVQLALDRKRWKYAIRYASSSLIVVVPAVISVLAFPNLLRLLATLPEGAGFAIVRGSTYLSSLLSGIPVLSYTAVEVTDDPALVVLLVMTTVYAFKGLRQNKPSFFIPLLWFITIVIASPENQSAWRFSLEALAPLTIMAGYGIASILPEYDSGRRKKAAINVSRVSKVALILLVAVTPILFGSWGQTLVSNSLADTGLSAQAQRYVYSSIYWLKANTPNDSAYLSISDWRFTYTDVLIGRVTHYNYTSIPGSAIQFAKYEGDGYIIVTRLVTENLPPDPSLFPWNTFPGPFSSNVTLLYSNPDVRIYNVTNLVGL